MPAAPACGNVVVSGNVECLPSCVVTVGRGNATLGKKEIILRE